MRSARVLVPSPPFTQRVAETSSVPLAGQYQVPQQERSARGVGCVAAVSLSSSPLETTPGSASRARPTLNKVLLDILTSVLFSLEPTRHPATTRPRLVRDRIAILYLDLRSSVACI